MRGVTLSDLKQFLSDYPGMSTAPCTDAGIRLRGSFRFKANMLDMPDCQEIEDCYKLEIFIPDKFPQGIPNVKEIEGKIPKTLDFHTFPDGNFCLGSPLMLLTIICNDPGLINFTNKCLIPYLYAVSYKLKYGGEFILGELAHGHQGIVDDYSDMLELKERHQIEQAIRLLCIKKRIANKEPCPCGCGKKLGACPFHHKLNKFRKMLDPALRHMVMRHYDGIRARGMEMQHLYKKPLIELEARIMRNK